MEMRSVVLLTVLCAVYVRAYIKNPGPTYISTKGEIWPKPQAQNSSEDYYVLTPRTFKFLATGNTCTLLENAFQRYFKILQQNTVHEAKQYVLAEEGYLGTISELTVKLEGPCDDSAYPTLDMDEGYSLAVADGAANVTAQSVWGVLRGLETFSQSVYLGSDGLTIRVNATAIEDYPRFKHRGLLLDTARHFIPLEQIYQVIDGLVANKMNVFHWHIVDDESFPFVSRTFPELSQLGAYDPELLIYTPTDVQEVIEYSRQRGIRVIVEFDTPGHTRSWGVSHPELLTECGIIREGAYGPMDPSKDTTYSFLQKLFAEVREVFKDQFIHLGADEVDFDCWEYDPNITEFMQKNNISDYSQLEGYYIQKVIDMVDALNFSSVVWEEVFKNGVELSNQTIVHIWRDWTGNLWQDTMNEVTRAGKTALLSACWYLDSLQSGGDWTKYYSCEPTNFGGTVEQTELILGGEACMWAEVVNEYNVVQRIWPRASATAEKLWSANEWYDEVHTARRLEEHVCRMNRRGIPAQPPNGAGFCL